MVGNRERQLLAIVVTTTTDAEKDALSAWAANLLAIRASALSPAQKARQAIAVTAKGSVLLPTLKILSQEVKRRGWDDRTRAGRFGLAGAAIGLAVFGGQGAGIAALGTAIGVPLWVVLGSGAAFAGVLTDELAGRKSNC